MDSHGVAGIVTLLKREAGEYLRAVAYYDDESRDALYVRDDVQDRYTDEEFDRLFDVWRRESRLKNREALALGNHHCTVRLYDDGLIFHFSQSPEVGTIVSLDPEAGRDIAGFVTRCLEQLHLDSPQHIKYAPTWLED